ncbi:GntR family transcriptional regulator [Motiliproteus coralliicola]|uniref:GntR family transcriptional regulator n=1 Tax=Motiliproteus coralliicola TaxID=2283196 RepID=A0A369WF89_9GAMM|nr:GntR family transcriptional regulator [Motiliproteus coralliicola]RDE19829.1 GntR family transcriptional regulator [Motiliproteus coralliicola]
MSSQPSRSEHAYQQLRASIHSGQLEAGSRIREAELADRFGISRTPIREAIRRLESEGLVCSSTHKGMMVTQLDYQSVIELYQMRELLEGAAAAQTARLASDAELSALRNLLNAERQAAEQGAIQQQARINKTFHQALYQAAHNRYLIKSLGSLQDAMALLGSTTYQVGNRNADAIEEHETLMQALEARNPEQAEKIARAHIRAALTARIELLNQQFQQQLPQFEEKSVAPLTG